MPDIERAILHSYPEQLRSTYKAALAEHQPAARHKGFVRLAESGLELLASMAISDYRARRWNDPSPQVEAYFERVRRPSLGHYVEALRTCLPETRPALLDFKEGEQPSLPSCGQLSQAIDGVVDAIDLDARNISRVVSKRLEGTAPKLEWLEAWDLTVSYRNKSEGHSTSHQWPVEHPDYFTLMAPFLEAAVTELLATAYMARIVSQHPVGRLVDVNYSGAVYEHVFDADDEGVPVRFTVMLDRSVTDLYAHPDWQAALGDTFLLSRTPSGGFEIGALFHDVRTKGLPTPIAVQTNPNTITVTAVASSPPSTPAWSVATASAAGTCGELVQGVTSDGHQFHVTCPIQKSATVSLRLRPAGDWEFGSSDPELRKLRKAVMLTSDLLGAGPLQVGIEHWTDLDVGKGMGSSTADIVAASRATAAALGGLISDQDLANIACAIESSDGSMYPGLVAFLQKEGRILTQLSWWPQFAVVMVVPPARFNTESADFTGKERLAPRFDAILKRLADGSAQRDPKPFGEAATESAALNQRFVPNPYFEMLRTEMESLGADGLNVAHTGTVAGLLFALPDPESPEFDASQQTVLSAASRAVRRVQDMLTTEVHVELTMTPACYQSADELSG